MIYACQYEDIDYLIAYKQKLLIPHHIYQVWRKLDKYWPLLFAWESEMLVVLALLGKIYYRGQPERTRKIEGIIEQFILTYWFNSITL